MRRGLKMNDDMGTVELHVAQEELCGLLMRISLGILTGGQTKILRNLDEVP